ncbi:hypothetical protein Cni_G00679 [Canna indica]|uniref:Uncharacterized protein n=1 Tax=Canna indica TaxID=4628 RepID=A0AAQ3PXJ5_9LILI|nr:hypothetical protein Cni_G00679 [Canna indica]
MSPGGGGRRKMSRDRTAGITSFASKGQVFWKGATWKSLAPFREEKQENWREHWKLVKEVVEIHDPKPKNRSCKTSSTESLITFVQPLSSINKKQR